LIKQWVDGLHKFHPHIMKHPHRPNIHASLYLYNFLLLFGPIMSWWSFPFEQLIATLQKLMPITRLAVCFISCIIVVLLIKFSGELEATITKSYTRGANLWWWFLKAATVSWSNLAVQNLRTCPDNTVMDTTATSILLCKYVCYKHNRFKFSHSSTYLGNILILYYSAPSSTQPIAGSIQKLTSLVINSIL
jgi:hypothetical protein